MAGRITFNAPAALGKTTDCLRHIDSALAAANCAECRGTGWHHRRDGYPVVPVENCPACGGSGEAK